jgi:Holliday junction resolvase RusA-like endonuclease
VKVELKFDIKGTHITVHATKNPDWKSSLKGDVDNYVKSVLDALNGVAWEDDKQIISLTVEKS